MTTYTLHLPRDARPGDPAALDRAVVVKDAFSWGAFFFTVLWFFAHRLWLAGLAVLVALVVFNGGLALLDVHPAAAFAAQLLLSTLIGLEANSLRRWTLARRGRPVADVVSASNREEAESRAFARWLTRPASVPVTATVPRGPSGLAARPEPVIGLFPDAERIR